MTIQYDIQDATGKINDEISIFSVLFKRAVNPSILQQSQTTQINNILHCTLGSSL